MIDSNAYSFDTPSDELGTGFISIICNLSAKRVLQGIEPHG